jgi:hypothetical protein
MSTDNGHDQPRDTRTLEERVKAAMHSYTGLKHEMVNDADGPRDNMPLLEYWTNDSITVIVLVAADHDVEPAEMPAVVTAAINVARGTIGDPIAIVFCAEAYVRDGLPAAGYVPGQLAARAGAGDTEISEALTIVGVDQDHLCRAQRKFHYDEGRLVMEDPALVHLHGDDVEHALVDAMKGATA